MALQTGATCHKPIHRAEVIHKISNELVVVALCFPEEAGNDATAPLFFREFFCCVHFCVQFLGSGCHNP